MVLVNEKVDLGDLFEEEKRMLDHQGKNNDVPDLKELFDAEREEIEMEID